MKDLSRYEYTIKDLAFTALTKNGGRYPFSNRVSEGTIARGQAATVGQGSGPNPSYHTKKTNEPTGMLSVPVDEANEFEAWLAINAPDGICALEVRRSKPGRAPVVSVLNDWQPLFGDEAFGTDATMVQITGNGLNYKKDITKSIT